MSVVYSSSHYSPGISVIFITNYFLYQRWKPICTFHKVAACQVLVSQASEDYNVRRKQDISRFWKRKANQFKIRWTKKPDASKLKNRYSESKLSTAARLKFYNSPWMCMCEWKRSVIAWEKGQNCVKKYPHLILCLGREKMKTSFTCFVLATNRQWANHFTTFYTTPQNHDAFGGPNPFHQIPLWIHS